MAENNHQQQSKQGTYEQGNREVSPKPESASKPGKRAEEDRERDRAGQIEHAHHDKARGDRDPGNIQNDRERASEAGRKGGQR